MKKSMLIFSAVILLLASCKRNESEQLSSEQISLSKNGALSLANTPAAAPNTFKVFDQILFYDGYAATVTGPVPAEVTRISNSKYVKKLSVADLSKLSNSLDIKVSVTPYCDNYDRIGSVGLSFIPKNSAFSENIGKHIEVGRFITPFMDKNKTPNIAPYLFSVNNVANLLRDANVLATYDIYVVFNLFGVPYAAQKEISGCAGHNETFYGTVEFINKSGGADPTTVVQMIQIATEKDLDNFTANNTDQIGSSKKTYTINLPSAITDARLYLITSAHGANPGGEEYIRRDHNIYFDNVLKLTYKPGGKSCEPYRQYNTQGNSIYGLTPKTASSWSSWSNWCPGDIIPIREISLGNLTAGNHTFKIDVPTAVFKDKQGYIRHSVYLQGR
ncbi:peptide-N-glycosidase F-related protein [Pedobacter jeongneungensis]|uniref:peptide-N-glycosidase F-related protein n=1 Tax=Pedobacter jeongneungensis TaxID=947309 RepID=UPI0004691215|nr:peptide-N-glycosidase F-related protein [Pedobacter jeongneungensis]